MLFSLKLLFGEPYGNDSDKSEKVIYLELYLNVYMDSMVFPGDRNQRNVFDDQQTQQLWKQVLGEMQVMLSPATFRSMMAQLRLKNIDNGIATLSCLNAFWQQQIETRYYNLLKNLLEKHSGVELSLLFEIRAGDERAEEQVQDLPLFSAQPQPQAPARAVGDPLLLKRARLVADYTFDNFAVGSTNQLAFAAAEAVAQNPGRAYNPLFIWGGVGVGKTHLMQAIAHILLQKNPELKVICCPGEEFTNEIVDAIRTKTTMAFKDRYRKMELLLLDDVQFLAGKDTAQEEFFHTFNAIQRAGGQIVLTSDRPPSEITKLEDRLRSRFEAGLIVDVANPDFELRTAIVLIKSEQMGIKLEMEGAQMIAEKYESAREMEGFMKHLLLARHKMPGASAGEIISHLLGDGGLSAELRMRKGVRPMDVLRVTANEFGIKVTQMKGNRRLARIVLPRQVAMYLMRHELGLQLEGIADYFAKDHTTVMHSVEKVEKLLGENSELREKILGIKQQLR